MLVKDVITQQTMLPIIDESTRRQPVQDLHNTQHMHHFTVHSLTDDSISLKHDINDLPCYKLQQHLNTITSIIITSHSTDNLPSQPLDTKLR